MSKGNVGLQELWPVIKEVIESNGEFTFKPYGISMLPLIRPGVDDVVLVRVTEKPVVGDVVLYLRDNGHFVLHRIVKIKGDEYVMCGDNQFDLEYGIQDRHILAKLKAVIKDGKVIDDTDKKYQKYIKGLPFRRFKKRTRNFLATMKAKIFKKKTV